MRRLLGTRAREVMHLRLELCAGLRYFGFFFFFCNESEMKWEKNARLSRPLDPNLLHFVCGLPQSGRVGDQDWEPADIQRDL